MSSTLTQQIQELVQRLGPGTMSSTAYDTAWVARLAEVDPSLGNRALRWLCGHQLADGSWGAPAPFYYHDRVICTLAAMIALNQRGRRARDRVQIEDGLAALERITAGATHGLRADPNGATVGFELIAPTLVAEAERLGIIKQQGDRILGRMAHLRTAKMEKLKGRKINRQVTPAFSSEMAGQDQAAILDIDALQESNGSIANSPSATAYFILNLKQDDRPAINYLHHWVNADGGIPNVAPFDIFEPAWVLWNLQLAGALDPATLAHCQPHLDFLQAHWDAKIGIGHASEYTPKDSDDTGLVYELLSTLGRQPNIEAVLNYEEESYFRCFALEANPSISANIHVLGALKSAGFDQSYPAVQKILAFLRARRASDQYWFDKWHASPYYATSHAILHCRGLDEAMCQAAIAWLCATQRRDGSWGHYVQSTPEETAYSLQALILWGRQHTDPVKQAIQKGAAWLLEHAEDEYHPMWIGKALYAPSLVVRATILSALVLSEQGI